MGSWLKNVVALASIPLCVACGSDIQPNDADIVVVGAGIAGLSAALEASDEKSRVLVIEASSVAGGHAVKAGGFAMVGTPLQERKGYEDTPEIAIRDLMAWGEDANPDWVRYFAENSKSEVYDWLTALGVQFSILLDTPEDTAPRFHFAGGPAVKVIVPMLRKALDRRNIRFLFNTAVIELTESSETAVSLRVRNSRTGAERSIRATCVILATGGFQSNLAMVRKYLSEDIEEFTREGERLLVGSGHYAMGDGIDLGMDLDAQLYRMNHQAIFINGLPDPRDPARGLKTENPLSIWVNSEGRRFVNEAADSKQTEAAGMALSPRTHWMIFDARGQKQLRIRGAAWLSPDTQASEILDAPAIGHKSDTIAALARVTGLPAENLTASIAAYNRAVMTNEDRQFQRFGPGRRKATTISEPPFYALQLFPMTRKSMGGLAIDLQTRVIGTNGAPIRGLYAAGELTGVGGINGSHGGSGTFLAPSVLTGRIAGNKAAAEAREKAPEWTDSGEPQTREPGDGQRVDTAPLEPLLTLARPGYWHFEQSHELVAERRYPCDRCHSATWPTGPATTAAQRVLQIASCDICH